MIRLELRNREQLRHMDVHKWLASERALHDVGQEAYIDWIKQYAARFTAWALTLPEGCIKCGHCCGDSTCPQPFNDKRLKVLNKPVSIWSS